MQGLTATSHYKAWTKSYYKNDKKKKVKGI